MPIIPSAKAPVPPKPTPPDVEDPVKYRFSGYALNPYLDLNGNIQGVFPHKTQPVEFYRRSLRYSITTTR